MRYPNIDAVVLIRQQHQFVQGMAGRPPVDERQHFLDYGGLERFPPNAFVPNPYGSGVAPQPVIEALQAYLPDPSIGAEYQPGEAVMWIGGD